MRNICTVTPVREAGIAPGIGASVGVTAVVAVPVAKPKGYIVSERIVGIHRWPRDTCVPVHVVCSSATIVYPASGVAIASIGAHDQDREEHCPCERRGDRHRHTCHSHDSRKLTCDYTFYGGYAFYACSGTGRAYRMAGGLAGGAR